MGRGRQFRLDGVGHEIYSGKAMSAKKIYWISLVGLVFCLSVTAQGAADCRGLLSPPPGKRGGLTPDQRFAAYFSELLEAGVLETEVLTAYLENLARGEIANPVTEEVALMNWEGEIHRDSFQEYVEGGGLTIGWQREWAKGKLAELERKRKKQRMTRKETWELALEDAFPEVRTIRLPGGRFRMGSPKGEEGRSDNENQVWTELSPFEVMDAPVTQGVWVAVAGWNPSLFQGENHCIHHRMVGGVSLCPDLPVENVSWQDVRVFLRLLNKALGIGEGGRKWGLPTEAQWEYAARGGTTGRYSFGDDPKDLKKYAVYRDRQTRPVRSKAPNPYGLYDVHGNVWEWTRDWYHENLTGGVDPLQTDPGTFPMARGGSWSWSNSAQELRSAYRLNGIPGMWSGIVGFRLVRKL